MTGQQEAHRLRVSLLSPSEHRSPVIDLDATAEHRDTTHTHRARQSS